VEPPEAAAKLEALSDIAQEFGIEWDMDRCGAAAALPSTAVLRLHMHAMSAVQRCARTPYHGGMGTRRRPRPCPPPSLPTYTHASSSRHKQLVKLPPLSSPMVSQVPPLFTRAWLNSPLLQG
jgi:hypothetical protein